MRFFIDNNLSPQLAKGMSGFGEDVEHLQDKFKPNAQDEEWLPYVGANNLYLVTRDNRIRRNPAEKAALTKNNVGAFFLGGKNRSRCELIQQLVRNWPQVKELSRKTRKPFAFRIPPTGSKFDPIDLS